MSDIEKATRAVEQVIALLSNGRGTAARRLIEMAYQCDEVEARNFIEALLEIEKMTSMRM